METEKIQPAYAILRTIMTCLCYVLSKLGLGGSEEELGE